MAVYLDVVEPENDEQEEENEAIELVLDFEGNDSE